MKALDSIDHHILNILQEDSNIAVKEIAEKVGLSFTPTYERIKSLKNIGIINKYVALVNAEKSGFEIIAYCNITLKEDSLEFQEKIKSEGNILEVVSMTGTYDYMLKIVAKNIKEYNKFVTEVIGNLPHIGVYHSNIVLNTLKSETKLPF